MENQNKCPMCGTKLKMINGRMSCKKCGYYVSSQNGQTDTQNAGYSGTQSTGYSASQSTEYSASQSAGYSGQTAAGGSNSQPTGAQSAGGSTYQTSYRPVQPEKKNSMAAPLIIGGVSFVVVIGVIVASILLSNSYMLGDIRQNLQNESDSSSSHTSTNGQGSDSSTSPTSAPNSQRNLPKSEFFIQLAEAIWGKGYRSISADEYASLTGLQIDQDAKTIYYWLDDEETQSLTYLVATRIDWSDLTSFTGLEWLSIDDDLSQGDLNGLNNLYAVYAENSISEYAKYIPHPENILELGAESSLFTKSLEGIENFPNLEYLSAEYDHLEDISALLDFPGLLGLHLTECDNLTDYSPLMTLTGLEELTIESSQLKTIDFIKVMPGLTSLHIENSKITNLDALASCPMLTSLNLVENYSVEDYSIIGELDQLQSLWLSTGRSAVLPSFEKLTMLESLALENVSDLSLLKDAVNVTYLSLEDCVAWNLDAITYMENLSTLVIHDFGSLTESLEPLTRLPMLTALDLEDTHIFGDITEIFSIPTLYYLNLSNCKAGIDFDNLPMNDTLAYLWVDDLKIVSAPDYNSGSYVSLAEHSDMFEHFPGLYELYAENIQLTNIDFVENMPNLQYLDITNNNVTSLKPLESLSDFRAVWCGKNTILENLSSDSDIMVITDEP